MGYANRHVFPHVFYSWYVIMIMESMVTIRRSYFPFYSWYVIIGSAVKSINDTSYFPFYSWYVIIYLGKLEVAYRHISLFILGML